MNSRILSVGKGWRGKLPALLVALAVLAALVAAITGSANPVNAVQFLPPGHWTFNVERQTAFHVAGATADVDASVPLDGDQGSSQVVQGDTSGYVVGSSRITEFGKSSLEVIDSSDPPADETPIALEVSGGPYLVYRAAGKVVRLGEEPVTIDAGAWLGVPVASSDGTLWLPRTRPGLICQLPPGADRVTCPVLVPKHHRGALSIVKDRPVFVDTSSDELYPIEPDGLGRGRAIGVDVPDKASVASSDVSGRVAILDSDRSEMHLVDSAEREPKAPVKVALKDGDYDGPVSTGTAVAVLDRDTSTLSTYDGNGERRDRKRLPKESGDPRLSRGEDDRVYVDGAEGDHVLVVDKDGAVTDVPIGEDEDGERGEDEDEGEEDRRGRGDGEDGDGRGDREDREDAEDAAEEAEEEAEEREDDPPPVPASAPGAPADVSAVPGNGLVTVSWDAASDNRAPITSYTVTGAGQSLEFAADARTATIRGLTNGTRYTFTVSATNSAGTGPGASTGPVTPTRGARPAAAPPGFQARYDAENDAALVSWNQPNLNGGTLDHYVVGATGLPNREVTGTSTLLSEIPGNGEIVFTVRAVTRTPDGQTLTGAAASRRINQGPSVTIARGGDQDSPETDCEEPDCSYLEIEMTGFEPNTDFTVRGESNEGGQFAEIELTTDDNGAAFSDEDMWFGYPDETVTIIVEIDGDDNDIESNELYWEPR
jgi:hypothetical protein